MVGIYPKLDISAATIWQPMQFNERLKDERLSRKWTQDEFADIAGTTKSTIQRLESDNRKPSKKMLAKIVGALLTTISAQDEKAIVRRDLYVAAGFAPPNQTIDVDLFDGQMARITLGDSEPVIGAFDEPLLAMVRVYWQSKSRQN